MRKFYDKFFKQMIVNYFLLKYLNIFIKTTVKTIANITMIHTINKSAENIFISEIIHFKQKTVPFQERFLKNIKK